MMTTSEPPKNRPHRRRARASRHREILLGIATVVIIILAISLARSHPGNYPAAPTPAATPGGNTGHNSAPPVIPAKAIPTPTPTPVPTATSPATASPPTAGGNASVVVLPTGATVVLTSQGALTLTPGTTSPLNIGFSTTWSDTVPLTKLTVTLISVNAPAATATLKCTAADFTIAQAPSSQQFRVPARNSTTLQSLNVAPASWPSITMLNREINQDGCVGATLKLTLSAEGAQ